jgi:cobalt-zinc-cadmium efflux system protein
MGAGHDHGAHAAAHHRGRLAVAFGLLAAFMVVEVVTALISGSLALLSDAGHMFTDVLGIAMVLAAVTAASRASRTPQRTFGLYRLEVLAALANAVLLTGVAAYVVVDAVRRLSDPPPVDAVPVLVVAAAGFGVNLVAFALLRAGAADSLSVRSAYVEVVGDLVGSLGAVAAGVVMALTQWWYADPIVGVLAALFILPRTVKLGRAAVRILVQAAPEGVDVTAVQRRLAALPGVRDVHDLHVWTLTSGMDVASAHLSLEPAAEFSAVLADAREVLHADFAIDHATLQVEPVGPDPCTPANW